MVCLRRLLAGAVNAQFHTHTWLASPAFLFNLRYPLPGRWEIMSYYSPHLSDGQWTSNRLAGGLKETEGRRRTTVEERPPPPGMSDTRTLDYKTDILNRNAAEASPTQQIHRTVSTILVLVRVSAFVLPPPMDSSWCPN